MSRIVVVGSGASGVHFALTALERGHQVVMLDVGGGRPPAVAPEASFGAMKVELADPVDYLLGAGFEGVVYPGTRETFYGFPPSKSYVFATPPGFAYRSGEMRPSFTFARGGFAETWTAGVYPFNDDDLADYPFGYEALRPGYREVARRVGIGAQRDDLERFMPVDAEYLEPLPLDPHSEHLLRAYARRRARLNGKHGWYLGRSRVATLSRDYRGRRGCDQLGRCLMGCPRESIYSPAATLRECQAHPGFTYLPGLFVTHFSYDDTGRITALHAEPVVGGEAAEVSGDEYVLAAGTLLSSKIFLDSIYRKTGRLQVLEGLMDNRQIHVPFLTLGMIGRPVTTASYQFHHLAFGLTTEDPQEYVHGQITTLKGAAVHPVVQNLPLDLRGAISVFRRVRAGLAIANVNLCDRRRAESRLTVRPIPGSERTELVVDYRSDPGEGERIRQAVRRVKRALGQLGGVVPPGLTRILPKGTSVHYAGTLPMASRPAPLTCSPEGRSHDFHNLVVADASTFPFLPAKNHTFTLMANAVRVAGRMG